MTRLVALDLDGGPSFVVALRRTWDDGDAVTVLPRRLPHRARADLLAHLRPHVVVGPDGDVIGHDPDAPLLEPGDALVAATSGSTGRPKVLVHTRTALAAHAQAVHRHLEVDRTTDRWLGCLPLDHLGGFGVVARAVLDDVPVDLLPGFEVGAVETAPTRLGTTLVSLVATALDRLDERHGGTGATASAFRRIVLGGAGDPTPRPANVVHTYGLTETGGGVVYEGQPLAGVEVRTDADEAIWLRTPTLARGRRAADGSVALLTGSDGWFRTGDLGRWDGRRLQVVGRADDLIITGGENVWPAPVEAVLRTHAAVADVVVVGAEDPEWGRRVVAVVVPTDPGAPPRLEELRALVRDHLPPAAAPKELRLVDALPRTPLGKVVRRLA